MKSACDLTKETGRIAQLLPSFIRTLCRERFEFDEDELLAEHQDRIVGVIEQSPIFNSYRFPEKHAQALRLFELDDLKELVKHEVIRQQMRTTCPFLRDPKKRSCWSCPVARAVVKELLNEPRRQDTGK